MGKPNPRKIPRTQADVDKAFGEGSIHGSKTMLTIILFILKDKHGGTDEEIKQLSDEVTEYCNKISSGEIKWRDVKLALKEEYDLTVRL